MQQQQQKQQQLKKKKPVAATYLEKATNCVNSYKTQKIGI